MDAVYYKKWEKKLGLNRNNSGGFGQSSKNYSCLEEEREARISEEGVDNTRLQKHWLPRRFTTERTIARMDGKSGRCWWCIRALKWIPVLFILSIVFWSYYAYVVPLCYYTIESTVQKVLYLFFYHILFFLFLWSYWQTIATDLAKIPDKFKLPDAELAKLIQAQSDEAYKQILEQFARDLPITNRTMKGEIRFCELCQLVRPDRSHHCSVCGKCVLKMDHHCPWVNNCVGFHNYKFFMLFLAYALLYCIFIVATSLQYFIMLWKGELEGMSKFHLLFLFFVALMFSISLNSLFLYHCYLIIHNRSTLEAFRPAIFLTGKDKDGFSLGKYNNFQEVFGDNSRLWFLPVFTSFGNGLVFPVRSQHQAPNTYNSMGSTQNRSPFNDLNVVQGATILALGTGTAVIGPQVEANEPLVDPANMV